MYLHSSKLCFLVCIFLFTPILSRQNLKNPTKEDMSKSTHEREAHARNRILPSRQNHKSLHVFALCKHISGLKNDKKINKSREALMLVRTKQCGGYLVPASEKRSAKKKGRGELQRDHERILVSSARSAQKPVKYKLFHCFNKKRAEYLHLKKTIEAAFHLRDFKEHFGQVQFNFVSNFLDQNLDETYDNGACRENDTTTQINLYIGDRWDFDHSRDVPQESNLKEALDFFDHLLSHNNTQTQYRVISPDSGQPESDDLLQMAEYPARSLKESKIISRRRNTRSVRKSVSKKSKSKDICCTKFDAAANIRGELYLFKNEQFWRIAPKKQFDPGTTSNFWRNFPSIKIDAVYSYDANIYFFAGKEVYVYQGNSPHPEQPRLYLTDFGLPPSLEGIDAVYISYDHAYFFQGKKYWKYHLDTHQMKPTYPRNISDLRGMPSYLDAAVTNPFDNSIYFIKGRKWWRLNTSSIGVEDGYPKRIGDWWQARVDEITMNRTETGHQTITSVRPTHKRPDAVQTSTHPAGGGVSAVTSSTLVYFLSLLLVLFLSL